MILNVSKCFLSALYNAIQCKMCGFREIKTRRTVTFDDYGEMPMFLYYDHTLNQRVIGMLSLNVNEGLSTNVIFTNF